MVQKLQTSEYLKRVDNMSAEERDAYEKRVGEWLGRYGVRMKELAETSDARMLNVIQMGLSWNDEDCQAFEEGALLISALTATGETWLPDMLYMKSTRRVIHRILSLMDDLLKQNNRGHIVGNPNPARDASGESTGDAEQGGESAGSAESVGPKMTAGEESQGSGTADTGDRISEPDTSEADQEPGEEGEVTIQRPTHIDQYVHLLPEKTQERASKVGDLLRDLDVAREKERLLMEDKTASDADRARWAKISTSIDNRLKSIYKELDSEWAKFVKSGRVTVDDLGNVRVAPAESETDGAGADAEPAELTSEQKARRRDLRKWLVDTRRGNGDTREEHVKKWQENFKEFVGFDGDAAYEDEKIKAAAEHYGIVLDKVTEEQKTEEQGKDTVTD